MTKRMKRWKGLFLFFGWAVIVVFGIGALAVISQKGADGALLLLGMVAALPFFLVAAVYDWMDGVLDHLNVISETQKATMEYTRALAKGMKIDREERRACESAENPDLRTSNSEDDEEMKAATESSEPARRRRAEKYDMEAAMRAARNLRK